MATKKLTKKEIAESKSWWIRDGSGKPNTMLTFATISFFVVTLNILLGGIGTLSIGSFAMTFIFLDSGTMAIYLGAAFTAYVTRKYTDRRFPGSESIDDLEITDEEFEGFEKKETKKTTTIKEVTKETNKKDNI